MKRISWLVAVALLSLIDRTQAASLYFTDAWNSTINRYEFDGERPTELIDFGQMPFEAHELAGIELDVARGKMYWVDGESHKVQRASLDGSGVEDLFISPSSGFGPIDLTLHRSLRRLFFSDSATGKIRAMNFDGTNVTDVISGLDDPAALAVDQLRGKLYWADDTHTIRRSNLDGTAIETVISLRTFAINDIVIDAVQGKIYWSNTSFREIRSANLDGTANQQLFQASSRNFRSLALDLNARKLYWSDVLSQNRVGRMNLDGTNCQILLTSAQVDPSRISGVAINPVPEPGTMSLVLSLAFLRVRRTYH